MISMEESIFINYAFRTSFNHFSHSHDTLPFDIFRLLPLEISEQAIFIFNIFREFLVGWWSGWEKGAEEQRDYQYGGWGK